MRYLTLTICFLLAVNLYGQRKKQLTNGNYFKIQGGLLYDSTPKGYFENTAFISNSNPENVKHPKISYTGVKVLNISYSTLKKDILNEFEIEFINYHQAADTTFFESPPFKVVTGGWAKKRTSVELKYFRSFIKIGENRNRLFLGPTASIYYRAPLLPHSNEQRNFPNFYLILHLELCRFSSVA